MCKYPGTVSGWFTCVFGVVCHLTGLFTDCKHQSVVTLWHRTHIFKPLLCPLLPARTQSFTESLFQALNRLCSSFYFPLWHTESEGLSSYYPFNTCFFHSLTPSLTLILPLCPSLAQSSFYLWPSSSLSGMGVLDFSWHPMILPSLKARLHWMTGSLVEVLLWLAQPVSQGAPSPCLSSSSVPTPQHPHSPPTPLQCLTMVPSVHRPHVSERHYLRPRSCLRVTIPETVRAPWKTGSRQPFRIFGKRKKRAGLEKDAWWESS